MTSGTHKHSTFIAKLGKQKQARVNNVKEQAVVCNRQASKRQREPVKGKVYKTTSRRSKTGKQKGRQKQVTNAGKLRLMRHNSHAGGKRPVYTRPGSKWGVETGDLKQVRWRK